MSGEAAYSIMAGHIHCINTEEKLYSDKIMNKMDLPKYLHYEDGAT